MNYIYGFIIVITIFVYTITAEAVSVLDAELKNWDGTPASSLEFPDIGTATTDNPWIESAQYIRVIYSSDETIWGIRIVTDNETNIGGVAPKIIGIWAGLDNIPGTGDDTWEAGPDGIFGTDDDIWGLGPDGIAGTDDDTINVSFGGLIDPATKDNPNYRADIAWQVFKDPVPAPDTIERNPFIEQLLGPGSIFWNVGTNPFYIEPFNTWWYICDWAYIVDKSNKWNGESAIVDAVFYDPPPDWNLRYEMIGNGNNTGQSYLAQYPVVSGSPSYPDIKTGDGDIAVYIAGCFGIPSDSVEGEFVGIIPFGVYSTVIYLELLHE